MSFIHSSGFAYIKNLIIGLGAAVVLIGALFKIMSWPGANEALMAGLFTEAGLFLMLGLLPPHKDYYWERLYPGLDHHGGPLDGAQGAESGPKFDGAALNKSLATIGEGINGLSNLTFDTSSLENQNKTMIDAQSKMVGELQTMAKSMSSLQALQNADFKEIENLTKGAGKFATALNEAITSIHESLEDTKVYREQLSQLNNNMQSLNNVYGGVLVAMRGSK